MWVWFYDEWVENDILHIYNLIGGAKILVQGVTPLKLHVSVMAGPINQDHQQRHTPTLYNTRLHSCVEDFENAVLQHDRGDGLVS